MTLNPESLLMLTSYIDNGTHFAQYRIYYEDTDAAGVVYYANYLKYGERARTEALRAMGINQSELFKNENIGFVVRRVEADYLSPARLDDIVTIETTLHAIGAARFTMHQLLKKDDRLLVNMIIEIVSVNDAFKPTAMHHTLKETMLTHMPLVA